MLSRVDIFPIIFIFRTSIACNNWCRVQTRYTARIAKSAERAKQTNVAILFLETRARSCLQQARWRLLRHKRATEAQVKKPPHTPAARLAAPHRPTSTQRCATPVMPSAFTRQPSRVTSLPPLAARQTAVRTRPAAPPSQYSLFSGPLQSQTDFPAERRANRQANRSRRPFPSPAHTHSSRTITRVEPVGEVLLQTLARFADQLAAQSAAQSAAQLSAYSAVMKRIDTLHIAHSSSRPSRATQPVIPPRPPSQHASPISPQSSHQQSALDARALTDAPLYPSARPLALDPRAAAHVPLGATQQLHQLAPPPLAPSSLASPALLASSAQPALPALPASFASCALSLNPAVGPQPGLLLAPLTFLPPPNSQTALPPSPNSQTARPPRRTRRPRGPIRRIYSILYSTRRAHRCASQVLYSYLLNRIRETVRSACARFARCCALRSSWAVRAVSVRGCCREACRSSRSARLHERLLYS